MIVLPFKRDHLQQMVIQQRQQGLEHLLTDEIYALLANSPAYTAIDGDEILACAGVIEVAPGRAAAWAYISSDVGSRMKFVTKAVLRFLNIAQYRRIEMDVDCDFPQAHRWAKLLGFTLECERRKSFTPDGRDCALYARVKA
jgi:RimJ/RimL family protein N-acetyltransferase